MVFCEYSSQIRADLKSQSGSEIIPMWFFNLAPLICIAVFSNSLFFSYIEIANLEFKVEQLTQTCQLLVTENARLSSAVSVLLASQRLPPITCAANSDWPVSSHIGAALANSQQPLLSISTSGLFSPVPHFRSSESVSGLSSAQSLAPAPLMSTLHAQPSPSLEKALDQVQVLAAVSLLLLFVFAFVFFSCPFACNS